MTGYVLAFVIGLLVGCLGGWRLAHITVATECERLGSFFVDDKTFECKLKEKTDD